MEVELQNGHRALVDEEDWDCLRGYAWNAKRVSSGKLYVVANVWSAERGRQVGVRMHRLILNAPTGIDVDHVNGCGTDNRRGNLRLATNAQNQQNTAPRGGSSRFKGVSWDAQKRKWRVAFNCGGRTHFVGYFAEEEDAARAYDGAILPLAGEFARLNLP